MTRLHRGGAAGLVVAVAMVGGGFAPFADAEERAPEPTISVLKRAGLAAHTEVAEEFAERCRVRARVLNIDLHHRRVRGLLRPQDVVLAVGQIAVDLLAGQPARIITALAAVPSPGMIPADPILHPEVVLRALRTARPTLRRVGIVHGPRTAPVVAAAGNAALGFGIQIVDLVAADGPRALRTLLHAAATLDAVWLLADPDTASPQLFQYALSLEIERALVVVAMSRQQVRSGALLAVDADPRAVGRYAADIANRLLAGEAAATLPAPGGALELSVNRKVAARLGVDLGALVALGARVE